MLTDPLAYDLAADQQLRLLSIPRRFDPGEGAKQPQCHALSRARHRCPSCGAMLTRPECLACQLRGNSGPARYS